MTASPPRLFLSPPHVGGRERELVLEAFDSGWIAPAGPMLERFEREFCTYTGIAHGVALSSGTAALHLSLRMLDVGPGDAVIAPSLTFMGGIAPIIYQGASPIFVDCDEASWCLDPALLQQAFDRTKALGLRARAVIPCDLYGQPSDLDTITEIANVNGAQVVLDSAESVGGLYHSRHAGKGALLAAFSFNGNKILTTSGGGMLVSDDAALIERARYLSTAARQPVPHYEHTEVGYNYRLSSLSAALGVAQLETIEDRVAARRRNFDGYVQRLSHLPGITFGPETPDTRHTRWLSVIQIDPQAFGMTREEVRLALEAQNIEARPVWKPMHLQPVFAAAETVGGAVCERLFENGLCLPSGTAMTDADLDRVCAVIDACAKRRAA